MIDSSVELHLSIYPMTLLLKEQNYSSNFVWHFGLPLFVIEWGVYIVYVKMLLDMKPSCKHVWDDPMDMVTFHAAAATSGLER